MCKLGRGGSQTLDLDSQILDLRLGNRLSIFRGPPMRKPLFGPPTSEQDLRTPQTPKVQTVSWRYN